MRGISYVRRWLMSAAAAAVMAGAQDAPAPRRVAPTPPAPPAEPEGVSFNFDQADLRMLTKIVGDMTGRRFVVPDTVSGFVTVISPGTIRPADVYPLFVSILESRGLTVVERDGASFIMPLPESSGPTLMPPVATGETPDRGGLVTRIFRPESVGVVDLAKAIEPLVRGAKTGALSVFAPGNHMIVTETEGHLRRIAEIIAEIDKPGATRTVEVVRLEYGSAEDLARLMNAWISGSESAAMSVGRHIRQVAEGAGGLPAGSMVVPSVSANSLVLVGTPVQIAEMKRIVALLDVEPGAGRGRLNAIFLDYLSAEEAAKSLSALLSKTVEKDHRQPIAVEPNIANNALLVYAEAADFAWVKDLVRSLDRVPHQVLVEILIAETDAGRQLDLGVEWSTIDTPERGETRAVGRSRPGDTDTTMQILQENIFPQGIAVGVAHGASSGVAIPFLLQALKQDRDVRILSSVPLLVQNNTEASVNVVENIPVLRSTIEGGAGTSRDVIQNIDRMDVGIKLKVTPKVNPNREVTLILNPAIEAIVDAGPQSQQFAPTIARREIKTTITVPDQTTVVISGLIREDKIRRERKVPLLGDIPWLGWLFRYRTDTVRRNNLLVFVTPRIIEGREQAEDLGTSMERRTGMPGVSGQLRGDAPAPPEE